MVLFCKIHDAVVHCASLVQSRCPGAPEGDIVSNPHFPVVCNKNMFSANRMHLRDLK